VKFVLYLYKNISELQADNAALVVENSDLNERVSSLVNDLSIKEATWCENEDKLKIEVSIV
jgi:regulator of replication initiation timing